MVAVPKPVGERCPELLRWARQQPCYVCTKLGIRQRTRSDAAHTPRVRIHGDVKNVVPLCGGMDGHHAEEERLQPEAFWAKYGEERPAVVTWERFVRETGYQEAA